MHMQSVKVLHDHFAASSRALKNTFTYSARLGFCFEGGWAIRWEAALFQRFFGLNGVVEARRWTAVALEDHLLVTKRLRRCYEGN